MPLLIAQRFWQRPEIPRIALLPIGLVLIVWVQYALGKVGYFDQVLLLTLYLLWAALLIVLGWWLREKLGLQTLATVLAASLLLGAEASALIGVLQHYSLHTFLDAVMLHAGFVAGNIGQPNQFANYITLGLISLGLLHIRWQLRVWQTVLLAIPLLFVLTLSGSRSPWLYLLCMAGMSFLWQRRDKSCWPLLNYSLLLLLGFSLTHWAVQLPWLAGSAERMTSAQRLFGGQFANYFTLGLISLGLLYTCWQLRARRVMLLVMSLLVLALCFYLAQWLSGYADKAISTQRFFSQTTSSSGSGSFSIRIYLWHGAWMIFTQFPLLGAGLGHFSWQIFQLGPVLRFANTDSRVWEHAHNLVMQIAAEMGLVGLLVLLGTLALWFWQAKNAQRSIHHWWGCGLLVVIGIHSLLEYPLWYAYFLGVTALTLGMLDTTTYRMALHSFTGRLLTTAILLLGLLSLSQLIYQYKSHNFEDVANAVVAAEKAENSYAQLVRMQLIRDKLTKMREHALPFRHFAEILLAEAGWDHVADNGALNKRVMHFSPNPAVVFREAWLLAKAGRQTEAYVQLELAIWAFPNDFPVAREQLHELVLEDPAHFADMLKFANRKYMEWQRETHATGEPPPA